MSSGWKITRMISTTLLIFWLFIPYVVGSILTGMKKNEFQQVCNGGRPVVLSYTYANSSATLYCLYPDARKNIRLTVNKYNGNWKLQTQKVVGEGFYWPFWL